MTEKDKRVFETAQQARIHTPLCLLVLILTLGIAMTSVAAPKKMATSQPENCALCHGKEKALPAGHNDIKKMNYEGCKKCHIDTLRLGGKLPGGHIHQLSGVSCEKCHGKVKKQTEVPMKQCVTCHNPEKLKEKTAKVKPENPHTSPHYGTGLDCNACHRQHGKSENFCAQCHKFNFVVP
ncbi:MAG: hypothetical protein C0392_14710 [Syntrophus sp. (in: bacteria)]|nr:hypothetical protein [Syntrophus sp. (in: bacteria)]